MFPRLVVFGLGNPGLRYASTRHNLGFRVAGKLALDHRAGRWRRGNGYLSSTFELESTRVILAKPQTFVNLSGRAAARLREDFGVEPGEILVVVDDTALPLGRLRLRQGGSDGGHNGLKSIIAELGTTGFPRLRMGIGGSPVGVDPADFVLSRFPPEETPIVDTMIERAVHCVESIVTHGLERAMGVFNTPEPDGG